SPDFRARTRMLDERVVGRYAVELVGFGPVHVDAEDGGEEVADVLASLAPIGRIGSAAVAGRDIEIAVRTELERAAVVATGRPRLEDFFALEVDGRRIGCCCLRTRQSHTQGLARLDGIADEDLAVFREARMECQTVGLIEAWHFAQVDEQIRLL